MNRFDNPFHDLWITEILNPDEFVKMFSPCVAFHAEELFGTGNVVVKGRQGSGKSMLLSLLSTKTRVSYARAQEKYPAPDRYKAFIAAGINLTRDNARIVASRLTELPLERRREWASATFADYVNYLLVQDLLQNVTYLAKEQKIDGVLAEEMPIDWSTECQHRFVEEVVASDNWYGYLDGCKTFEDISRRVSFRLTEYRRYFNFNSESLDRSVETTKTDIGEPAATVADALRKAGVIPSGALVFLKIDQHEELYELERSSGYADVFRQVINRQLAMRDGRVSYRVGTRHYAWSENISVWGSGAHLEVMRDYSIIDIDEMLRRNEHPSNAFSFSKFAEDVFRRRLSVYGFQLKSEYRSGILREIFGETLTAEERARIYVKNRKPMLHIPVDWAPEWREALERLWVVNPLGAKLGEVWLRQKAQQAANVHKSSEASKSSPWLEKTYWMKERKEAALIQMAGDANEMLIWSGDRHLVDLAGWNILAFMTICRAVWAAWLRRTSNEELQRTQLPKIGADEQVIGVYEASRTWAEKLKEGSFADRYGFVTSLGVWFSARIRGDKALSYPGHNGFSLLQTEFEQRSFITNLIRFCRDQGDFLESPHTTKAKNARPRIKWHLNPLLAPYFRIPHVRTKEPIYTSVDELDSVFRGSVPGIRRQDDGESLIQVELF